MIVFSVYTTGLANYACFVCFCGEQTPLDEDRICSTAQEVVSDCCCRKITQMGWSRKVKIEELKSLLFHDVCIEIVTVKQSALSLFAFSKFGFMCVCLYFSMFLKTFFPQVSDSLSLLLYSLHVRLLRASIRINQLYTQLPS